MKRTSNKDSLSEIAVRIASFDEGMIKRFAIAWEELLEQTLAKYPHTRPTQVITENDAAINIPSYIRRIKADAELMRDGAISNTTAAIKIQEALLRIKEQLPEADYNIIYANAFTRFMELVREYGIEPDSANVTLNVYKHVIAEDPLALLPFFVSLSEQFMSNVERTPLSRGLF